MIKSGQTRLTKPGVRGPEFALHVIDDSFSRSHALGMADINARFFKGSDL